MSMSTNNNIETIKIVLLGDSLVGKTSIVTHYITGASNDSIKPTVGAAFFTKETIIDGKSVELLLWDTAGQEVYRGLAPMYYRSAKIAIVVFDITSRPSFDSVGYWIRELKSNVPNGISIVICGNKIDLEQSRAVAVDEAQELAKSSGGAYVETSAKSGIGIDRLFQLGVSQYLKSTDITKVTPENVSLTDEGPSHPNRCC